MTKALCFLSFVGVCTNATAPSVSSINRILRNRAAERAAAEFARAAGYGLYHPHPYAAAFPWHPATAHMWSAGTLPTGPLASLGSQHNTMGSPQSSSSPGSAIGVPGSDMMIPRLMGKNFFWNYFGGYCWEKDNESTYLVFRCRKRRNV